VSSKKSPPEFGPLGRPLNQSHPFLLGFLGGLGVLTAVALAQAISSASQVFVLIVTALFLAVGLNPGVEWLRARGLSRNWALTTMVIAIVLFFTAFFAAILPPVIRQTTQLITRTPEYLENLLANETISRLDERFDFIDAARRLSERLIRDGELAVSAFGGVLGVGRVVIGGVVSLLIVLVLTLYFLSALPKITRVTYRLIPASRRERVTALVDEILIRVGAFVGGQLIVATFSGLSTLFIALILGVPYAVSLAMFVAIFGLIPLIGATLGAIAVVAVGLTVSITTTVILIVFYLIYQQIENYIIYPRVMQRSVKVPTVVTIVAALIGASLFGLLGGLLAIPTAAAILLIIDQVAIPRADSA
jgi:predicted PurR-regulated permease PerM